MPTLLTRARRLVACLALACSVTACISVDGPDTDELAAARGGDTAIALFRMVVTSNAGQLSPFDETLESQCMSVGLSDPDEGGRMTQIDGLESFSEDTLSQGWLYFVLPPGRHALAVNPPTMYDPRGTQERWNDAAHWGFVVPENTPVVYIGTLRVHCRAEASDFGGARVRDIRALKLRDESAVAVAIAARHLPDLPAPFTLVTKRLFSRESTLLRGATD